MIDEVRKMPLRRRGRPTGTDIKTDLAVLRQAAGLLVAGTAKRPTDAFRRLVPTAGDSEIRRYQVKWKKGGEALLAEARTQCAEQEQAAARRRAEAAAAMPRSVLGSAGAFDFSNLERLARMIEDSPMMKLQRQLQDNPINKLAEQMERMQKLLDSPLQQNLRKMDDLFRAQNLFGPLRGLK